MSEPTPVPKLSAAIVAAERRLWLLDLMLAFCAALLRVVNSVEAGGAWQRWAGDQASYAISRAMGLARTLNTRTERRLFVLRCAVARPTVPVAARHERPEAPDRAPRAPRQVGQTKGDDAAFRARIEALEAFLDRQADGLGAGLLPLQIAGRLCEALGLNPDWSRWLEDDWLAANLNLSRLPALSAPAGEAGLAPAPLCIPPPPLPPALAGQVGPRPPPHAIPDDPSLLKTYIPGFKEALGRRVFEAIEVTESSRKHAIFLFGILEQRLATNEPYMWGGYIPLRGAVQRLCGKLRLLPDWKRWRGDGWIKDGWTALGDLEDRIRAAGIDLG